MKKQNKNIYNLFENNLKKIVDLELEKTKLKRQLLDQDYEDTVKSYYPDALFKKSSEPSSSSRVDEPSPAQMVAGKDLSNPLIGEAFPKSLIDHMQTQILETLRKEFKHKLSPSPCTTEDEAVSPKER
ncbi:hypothetical protein, partial [Heyndrickxia coagulans]|uniref:hypothetical protein n=1 Tax=Heyndrickxia coagulans TaxID=1398 RepID=UPI00214D7E94